MKLSIANYYGNVDVRKGVPDGHVHIKGHGLTRLCAKLKMRYCKAMVDFDRHGRKCYPVFDGVVIAAESQTTLLREIEAMEQRRAKREAQKKRREERIPTEIKETLPSLPRG